MKQKSFLNRILQNTQKPEGFFGRMILRGMNKGHAPLAEWGMSCMKWQHDWNVLDIGCGGGANLAEILKRCPDGKVYGIDLSPESVAFARKKNKKHLNTRCFVEQGSADQLPYADQTFDAVTAIETVYFWGNLNQAFIEVARILKENGHFLICCEMSNPENTVWSNRIEGMIIHSGDKLKSILTDTGFTNIAIYHHSKEILCVIAQKDDKTDKS